MNVRAFIQRYPVGVYFTLAFLISYGGFVVVDGPRLVRGEALRSIDALLLFPALVVGVGLLGIILTAVIDGRNGLRDLFARMRRADRFNVGWYAPALLIPPVVILTVLFCLSVLVSPSFAPGFFPLGIVFGLVPGFFEEIGWMGFAFPKLRMNREKRSVLATGVILGVLWGLWHAPVVDYLGAAAPHGAYWLPFFLSFILLRGRFATRFPFRIGHLNPYMGALIARCEQARAAIRAPELILHGRKIAEVLGYEAPSPFSFPFAAGLKEKEDVVQLLYGYGKAQRIQHVLHDAQVVEDFHDDKRMAVE